MKTAISAEEFESLLHNATPARRLLPEPDILEALSWLALAPAWPLQLATRGFPTDQSGTPNNGEPVVQLLRECESKGVTQSGPGESPMEGIWYWMDRHQRTAAIRDILDSTDSGLDFLSRQLIAAASQMKSAAGDQPLNPTFERWIRIALARPSEDETNVDDPDTASLEAMASLLEIEAASALDKSEKAGDLACPDALHWIAAAQPLSELFGGQLEVAVARAQRRLEMFRRNSRDKRYLRNYFIRLDQEKPFEELIKDSSDKSWALHYVGMGGIGKTMLIRRIRTVLAPGKNLAVGHVDFDNLNPDYPRRAPGLLLMGFAEDLRLNDDPDVVKSFIAFDKAIRSVHEKLAGIFRTGASSGDDVATEGLRIARGFFVEALEQITRQGKRPLLILDTCEELARLRNDGKLPENVAVTFEILQKIHDDVPQLRVIFSGRRPLARVGFDWEWPSCALPERKYLRLQEVVPFTDSDAKGFLEQYSREGKPVPKELWPPIMEQSCVDRNAPSRRRRPPPMTRILWTGRTVSSDPADKQYYPYDIDLYASWATGPGGLDPQKIKAEGSHYYVKDRIVDRVSFILRPWLPDLALLGRFDRSLLEKLTGIFGPDFDDLWNYIVQQEWTEADRNAHRDAVWGIEPHLRERLLSYYRDRDFNSLKNSLERTADLLQDITLTRPFSELTPAYFEACFEVTAKEPGRAAEWWESVERKIASEAQWDWGRQLTDLLLDDESIAGRTFPGIGPVSSEESVFRPAILATQAAVNVHLAPARNEPVWAEVVLKTSNHPTPAGRERLKHRGLAGVVACRQYAPNRMLPGEVHNYLIALRDVVYARPSRPDPDTLATEIAMFEGVLEVLENVEWPDADSREIVAGFHRLLPIAPPDAAKELAAFCESLEARFYALRGEGDEALLPFNRALEGIEPGPRKQIWLDWKLPNDLQARLALEYARIAKPNITVGNLDSVDADRLAAAKMVWESWEKIPVLAGAFQGINSRLAVYQPLCNAHRTFPPYFATAITSMADSGQIEGAQRRAGEIIANRNLPLDVRQAADRSLCDIGIRMLLFEEKLGVGTTLADSPLPADKDRLLILRTLQSLSETQDRRQLIRNLKTTLPDGQPRRAAENLLLCGLLETDLQAGKDFFERARKQFLSSSDALGSFLCTIGIAMANAYRRGNQDQLLAEVNLALSSSACPSIAVEKPAANASAPEWVEYLNALPKSWRPWMGRLAACAIRSQEFANPGEQTKHFQNWLIATYGTDPPSVAILAKPILPFGAVFAGMGPKAARVRDIVLGIIGFLFVIGLALLLYRGYTAGLHWLGFHLPTWANILSLMAVISALSSIPSLWRSHMLMMARLYLFERIIESSGEITSLNDPLTHPWTIKYLSYFRPLKIFSNLGPLKIFEKKILAGKASKISGLTTFDQPYAKQSEILLAPQNTISRFFFAIIPSGVLFDTVLYLNEDSAAAPWEAVIGLASDNAHVFQDQHYRFWRRAIDVTSALDRPMPAKARVATWAHDLSAARFAAAWTTALAQKLPHALEAPLISGGDLRTDSSIAILHFIGKAVETSAGLRIQFGNESESVGAELRADQFAAALPSLRVCILQDLPAEPGQRTTSDRYVANIARRFGFQVHRAGVSVVIVIPPLGTELGVKVISTLAETVASLPKAGVPALVGTVQKLRELTAKEANSDAETATEMAFDICLYAPSDLNLELDNPDTLVDVKNQ